MFQSAGVFQVFALPLQLGRGKLKTVIFGPIINGDDLKQLGLPPGPGYRRILEAVEEAQLDGRVTSKEQALQYVRQYANQGQGMALPKSG